MRILFRRLLPRTTWPASRPELRAMPSSVFVDSTIVRQHTIHMVSINFFNMGNRLYRNHVSFLKEDGPQNRARH
jgi:hypothetical protein